VVGGIHSHRNCASPANDRMAIDIAMAYPGGRRVALLYSAGRVFGCRHCRDLAYDCQNETPYLRAPPALSSSLQSSI
jgi:hypothetical protein